jgi:hypothetical protein
MCSEHSRHGSARSTEMPEDIGGVVLANELSIGELEIFREWLASSDGCGGLTNLMLHA